LSLLPTVPAEGSPGGVHESLPPAEGSRAMPALSLIPDTLGQVEVHIWNDSDSFWEGTSAISVSVTPLQGAQLFIALLRLAVKRAGLGAQDTQLYLPLLLPLHSE